MKLRRSTPYLIGLAVLGLAGMPTAGASSAHRQGLARLADAGHVAYVTADSQVRLVTVKTTGTTSSPTRLGPVTRPSAHRTVQVEGFVGSGDGRWLAWLEVMARPNGAPTRAEPLLVVRDLKRDQVFQLRTNSNPVGFAGDQLVLSGTRTSRLELRPTPHLVSVPGAQYAHAAYPEGVVDVQSTSSPAGPDRTDRLRLTRFDGTHTVLYNYLLSPSDTRIPNLSFVSGDGKRLVVERGDHTDFGGIGPSSMVDEFALDDGHQRSTLGHYGTAKQAWRIGGVSFAWPSDDVWAVWERATANGATSVVATRRSSGWKRIVPHGIAVAGNLAGYVVVQPGRYVFASDGLRVSREPTASALLLHGTSVRVLGIQGTQFAWVR